MEEWQKLNYSVPIKEFSQEAGEFRIRGVAINETVTRNGHMFAAEELQKSAATLRNKPILKNHYNTIEDVAGWTTDNVQFDESIKAITFEGVIEDEKAQQLINKGLVKNVSVGAFVKGVVPQFDSDEDRENNAPSSFKLTGIEFVELSLVAVPADPGAGFAKAIAESYSQKMMKCQQPTSASVLNGRMTVNGGSITYSSSTSSSRPTKKGDSMEADELKKLQEENAKLEVENLKLRNEALKREQDALKAKITAKPEDEAEAPASEDPESDGEGDEDQGEDSPEGSSEAKAKPSLANKTKGKVSKEKPSPATTGAYALERGENGGFALVANYDSMEGVQRLKREVS